MRILLAMGSTTGGIGVHVRSLAESLKRDGHQVVVTQDFRRIRRTAAGADIVHAHGIRAGAAAGVALTGTPVRLVVTLHNAPLPDASRTHRELTKALERIIARRADVVLGASPDLVARAEASGARDARFAPVAAPPSLPPSRARDAVRAELQVPSDARLVLAVGRLAPQKDYPTLLDALQTTPHSLVVVIAGDGPLRAELQTRIDAERLPVRLLGHRTDIPDLLNAADAFVMCSTWEARPLALQEAIRAGVPSVATAVGGIPGLVGPAAVLVPPGRPLDLADALRAVGAPGTALAKAMSEWVAAWPGPADELRAVLAAYAVRTT